MNDLSIEKFSPQKAELKTLADKYKDLDINGVDDRAGYLMVDEARKDLKKKRVLIKKTGKEMRDEALKFQRSVIALEKELIEIIEPIEIALKEKQDKVDNEIEREKRKAVLPERQEKMKEIELEISDDELLDMDPKEFTEFYNLKKGEYLDKKEAELKAEQERLAREKEIEEAKKKAKEEAEKKAAEEAKRKEAEAKEREEKLKREAEEAKKKAEEEKKKAVEEAERKAKEEKEKLIAEQKRKEEERKEKEEAEKKAAEEKAKKEREEQEALEKKNKYIKFLADHGCTEDTKGDYQVIREGNKRILYKKIATYED